MTKNRVSYYCLQNNIIAELIRLRLFNTISRNLLNRANIDCRHNCEQMAILSDQMHAVVHSQSPNFSGKGGLVLTNFLEIDIKAPTQVGNCGIVVMEIGVVLQDGPEDHPASTYHGNVG